MHAGGEAIYVKESFDVIQVEEEMEDLELLSIEIQPKEAKPSFFSHGTGQQLQMSTMLPLKVLEPF